jgi:signal transduction histidine kinase
MIAQSRHAAMGEMISMIAHQWRQPLSIISMGANNILADIELDILDTDTLEAGAKDIIAQTQELSKTIDDFKNFFKPIKNIEEVTVEDIMEETLRVIGKSLENNNIKIITNFDTKQTIQTYSRELMQVFINIINNAKEALVYNNIANKQITITTINKTKNIDIKICDNGTGIAFDVINKIFDPYFTTKDEHNGTGLGLYISKTIIEKHLLGSIKAYNIKNGACFEINIPYNLPKEKNE